MSNLAHYSGWNICLVIKTGKYVNLHSLIFQNLQTELKYHDYSSTICILKITRFLSRKCRKLDVSDDVIRKIVTSAKIFLNQNVSYFYQNVSYLLTYQLTRSRNAEGGRNPPPPPEITLLKKPGWNRVGGRLFSLQFWQKIKGQTSKFARKLHFLGIRKVLNLGLKAEKPLQNENHTEDWALGNHPRDNGHVTH